MFENHCILRFEFKHVVVQQGAALKEVHGNRVTTAPLTGVTPQSAAPPLDEYVCVCVRHENNVFENFFIRFIFIISFAKI